jgi:hypothetical protein
MPTMSVPPVPPVPALPAIPAALHAACADKAQGARLTHVPRQGERMIGVCTRAGGKPAFQLREYRRDD